LAPVPAPHPASVRVRPSAGPERGFATHRIIRTEAPRTGMASKPAAHSSASPTPRIDLAVRPTRHDDGVMRPEWPVLPPPKK
jgi:hypothetical protein